MVETTSLLQDITKTIDALNLHKQIAAKLPISIPLSESLIIDDAIESCNIAYQSIERKQILPENYIKTISMNLSNIFSVLHHRGQDINTIIQQFSVPRNVEHTKNHFFQSMSGLKNNYNSFKFIMKLFIQFDFFENNIVLIGSNGSGKTTLANRLKSVIGKENGIIISAQRVLRVSKYTTIDSFSQTMSQLKQSRQKDKSYKDINQYSYMQNEFDTVLKNLVADNIAQGLEYSQSSKDGIPETSAPRTNLDNTVEIWNSLISHRELSFADDHVNIAPKTQDGTVYDLVQMSDGEKVMLYLIAQVLQVPEHGFIIVDEPEIFLHRAILRKLWDRLEAQRPDCIFIYLTHDIEFAVTRDMAQKVWIRSYTATEDWEFEKIDNTELPEELLLELLGSQKKILFCEGKLGGDEKMYNVLFPNFTIKPVGGCKNVIDYVRAFNRIPNRLSKAFGIIDADFRGQTELVALKEDGVFGLEVAEIENLLMDEDFLKICAKRLHFNNGEVETIKKKVIGKLCEDIEMQISHFLTSKINHIFNNSHVSRQNNFADVKNEYDNFTSKIDITKWHSDRKQILEDFTTAKDYVKTIKRYNNKGLIAIAAQMFKKGDFREFAMKELKNNKEGQKYLKNHFPSELTTEHDSKD